VETRERNTQRWSFGIFEVEERRSELLRGGTPVKLREQSFRILLLLLERAGDIVTREELRQVLWPSDTYVDFDHSLNTAIMKLRDALGSLERASKWLLERVTSKPNDALAGATPYLRLFGSTLGGCMLAGEALAARDAGDGHGDPQRYVTLARFFAENITVQATSLEKTVMDGADAVTDADAVLLG